MSQSTKWYVGAGAGAGFGALLFGPLGAVGGALVGVWIGSKLS